MKDNQIKSLETVISGLREEISKKKDVENMKVGSSVDEEEMKQRQIN